MTSEIELKLLQEIADLKKQLNIANYLLKMKYLQSYRRTQSMSDISNSLNL
jgi:hypothetical protein